MRNPIDLSEKNGLYPNEQRLIDLKNIDLKKNQDQLNLITQNPQFHNNFYLMGNPKEMSKKVKNK